MDPDPPAATRLLSLVAFQHPPYQVLLMLLGLLLLHGFLRAFSAAVQAQNGQDLQPEARHAHTSAGKCLKWREQPERCAQTLQMISVLLTFLYGYQVVFSLPLAVWPWFPGLSLWLLSLFSLLIWSSLFLLLGEWLPAALGRRQSECLARLAAPFYRPVAWLFRPLVGPLAWLQGYLLRRFGVPEKQENQITEEALLSLLDAGNEAGHIGADDKDLIENIFEFDDKSVADVMTHRTDISALPLDADWRAVLDLVNEDRYSRFPVFRDNIDDVVGILHAKDLLSTLAQGGHEGFTLTALMRQPVFTPESKNVKELFTDLKQRRAQMAIVIDEYGGTAGLVTLEDLIEELLGDIEDEYDDEEQTVLRVAPSTWLFDGSFDPEEASRLIGVQLPNEYGTLSGLVIDRLDRIPDEEECPEVTIGGLAFKILAMEDNRIHRLRVTRLDEEEVVAAE